MFRFSLLLVLLLCPIWFARGQEPAVSWDDLVQSAEQWAKENLDEDALRMLQGPDQKRVRQFLEQLQKEFQGAYVIDLARLRQAAREIITLLEQYEETLPYAIWLKSQLEYLEVAEQLRLLVPPPPKREPGKPTNPKPEVVQEIWIKRLAERPWPKNAKPYVTALKPIFAAEGVPPELVWVAEVESSFDPRARSPAGAAGMFQLMPSTAKRFGLHTWALDQRLKPEASGRAAAQYLKYLHGHFKDWRLALAAYNAGEGTVDRLLARYKTKSYATIATHLPAETQLYVPRVEATILKREGVRLAEL